MGGKPKKCKGKKKSKGKHKKPKKCKQKREDKGEPVPKEGNKAGIDLDLIRRLKRGPPKKKRKSIEDGPEWKERPVPALPPAKPNDVADEPIAFAETPPPPNVPEPTPAVAAPVDPPAEERISSPRRSTISDLEAPPRRETVEQEDRPSQHDREPVRKTGCSPLVVILTLLVLVVAGFGAWAIYKKMQAKSAAAPAETETEQSEGGSPQADETNEENSEANPESETTPEETNPEDLPNEEEETEEQKEETADDDEHDGENSDNDKQHVMQCKISRGKPTTWTYKGETHTIKGHNDGGDFILYYDCAEQRPTGFEFDFKDYDDQSKKIAHFGKEKIIRGGYPLTSEHRGYSKLYGAANLFDFEKFEEGNIHIILAMGSNFFPNSMEKGMEHLGRHGIGLHRGRLGWTWTLGWKPDCDTHLEVAKKLASSAGCAIIHLMNTYSSDKGWYLCYGDDEEHYKWSSDRVLELVQKQGGKVDAQTGVAEAFFNALEKEVDANGEKKNWVGILCHTTC